MATRFDTQTGPRLDGRPNGNGDPSMRDLLRQLADDGANLVRGEIALAKLEVRESARTIALGGVRLAAAFALVLVGVFAITAFMIIGLGLLLNGMYWASALIVGLVLLAVGGLLAQRGIAALKENSLKPEATVESLQEDKRWASREVRELKAGLKSS
jgi:hypothetical protein